MKIYLSEFSRTDGIAISTLNLRLSCDEKILLAYSSDKLTVFCDGAKIATVSSTEIVLDLARLEYHDIQVYAEHDRVYFSTGHVQFLTIVIG